MIEEAIAGLKTINTWSTNSATLSTADGSTSESRAAILNLTDTTSDLSGAGTVICPAVSKVYIVKNATGQTITVKTASGSGIAIPDGTTGFVYCDGTNVLEALTNVAGNLVVGGNASIGGNLTVTGTTTFNGGTLTLGDANTDNIVFGGEVDSNIIPDDDDTHDLGSSSKKWKDIYIDGTAYLDAINFNGTAITSTAAELNILDGVTSTASELNILDGVTATTAELNILDGVTSTTAELNILDGVTASAADINLIDGITNGTVIASKAIITDSNKDITGGRNITISGELDAASLDISGDADIDGTLEADAITVGGTALNTVIAGVTTANSTLAATVTVADSNANTNFPVVFHDESNGLLDDTGALRYNPSTGELLVPKLTVAGTTTTVDTVTMQAANAIIFEGATADAHETTLTITDPTADRTIKLPNQSGTIPVLAADSDTAITSTPAELNILDGVTSTATELNILDGVTSTTAELNILDGVTSTTAELNLVDGSSAGTIVNSKAVVYGSSGEVNATTLQIAGTSITSTAAELNILDGVTSTTAELNILDGVTSTAAELNILDGVTSTATELNIMDGDTSASSTTLVDADRVVTNDNGTMKQVALSDVKTYLSSAGFSTDDPTALAIALG
jgi:cytoskeletal protein CcmA (bactofilin family)